MTYIDVDSSNKWSPKLSVNLRVRDKEDTIIVEINGKDYVFDKTHIQIGYHGDTLAFIEERYTPGT